MSALFSTQQVWQLNDTYIREIFAPGTFPQYALQNMSNLADANFSEGKMDSMNFLLPSSGALITLNLENNGILTTTPAVIPLFSGSLSTQNSLRSLNVGANLFTSLDLSFDTNGLASLEEFKCNGSAYKTVLNTCNLVLNPSFSILTAMKTIEIKNNPSLNSWSTILSGNGFTNGTFKLIDVSGDAFPADMVYFIGNECANMKAIDGVNNATFDISGGTSESLAKIKDLVYGITSGSFPATPFNIDMKDGGGVIIGNINVFYDDLSNLMHVSLNSGTYTGVATIDDGAGNVANVNPPNVPGWYGVLIGGGWTVLTN